VRITRPDVVPRVSWMQPKFITSVMSKLPCIGDNVDGATSSVHPAVTTTASAVLGERPGPRNSLTNPALRYTDIVLRIFPATIPDMTVTGLNDTNPLPIAHAGERSRSMFLC
jgi:hypothetical protein